MADSYVTTLIIMTVLILTPLFIGLFLYIKGYSLSDIWKKAVDIFLKNKKAIIITVAIICAGKTLKTLISFKAKSNNEKLITRAIASFEVKLLKLLFRESMLLTSLNK